MLRGLSKKKKIEKVFKDLFWAIYFWLTCFHKDQN